MYRVRIYTKLQCPFSASARALLEELGVPYDEIDITDDPERRAEMIEAAGGASTTPQIFIDGEHIGGLEELEEENRQGRLAMTLASGLGSAPPA
jgi:glutaredoxin 3